MHKPVLLQEAIDGLEIKKNGIYIDATFGFGGHSGEILKKIGGNGKLIGLEADKEIYDKAKNLFKFNKNLSLYNRNFIHVADTVLSNGISKVDGILFDLGVNLYQIKKSGRGFSFLTDEMLDMRINTNQEVTAYKIVNSYSQEKLAEIFQRADEERSWQIAKAIVYSRRKKKIKTTLELAKIVESAKRKRGKVHPATKVFMALRIEVNNELENLSKSLGESVKILKKEGRIVVISFHSGEDRLVKYFFKEKEKEGKLKIINKKVITASYEERIKNPLSRSAKMRVAEKVS